MSVASGREDERPGGQWTGVGANDAAGGRPGCGDAMAAVVDGVSGVNGDVADVAEASTGCGVHCGWMCEPLVGCGAIWGAVVASEVDGGDKEGCASIDVERVKMMRREVAPEVIARAIESGRSAAEMERRLRVKARERWEGIEVNCEVILSVSASREVMGLWMLNERDEPVRVRGRVIEVQEGVPGFARVLIKRELWVLKREDIELVEDGEDIGGSVGVERKVWWVDGEPTGL